MCIYTCIASSCGKERKVHIPGFKYAKLKFGFRILQLEGAHKVYNIDNIENVTD